MGNRALVCFVAENVGDGTPQPVPAVYLHHSGSDVRAWLQELRDVMVGRDHDVDYAPARFAQIAGNHIKGNMSLGILLVDLQDADSAASPAEGDAGLFVVDVRAEVWVVDNFGGNRKYGAFHGEISPSKVSK